MAKKPAVPKRPAAKRRKYVSKPGEKAARNKRLAAGVVAGVPVVEMARQEGLSRTHTSFLANSVPVRHIITDLVNANLPEVEFLFMTGLQAIRDALTNGNSYAVEKVKAPDGTVAVKNVLLGPDHYARMQAMKVLVTIVCAGRAQPKPVDPRDLVPKLTYEDLVRISQEQDAIEAAEAAAQAALEAA